VILIGIVDQVPKLVELGKSDTDSAPSDQLSHRIYNIGSERPMIYGEFVEAVKTAVPDAQISLQPGRNPRYRPNTYMDITRVKEEVGYRPKYDIKRGVEEYIDWLRSHPE